MIGRRDRALGMMVILSFFRLFLLFFFDLFSFDLFFFFNLFFNLFFIFFFDLLFFFDLFLYFFFGLFFIFEGIRVGSNCDLDGSLEGIFDGVLDAIARGLVDCESEGISDNVGLLSAIRVGAIDCERKNELDGDNEEIGNTNGLDDGFEEGVLVGLGVKQSRLELFGSSPLKLESQTSFTITPISFI